MYCSDPISLRLVPTVLYHMTFESIIKLKGLYFLLLAALPHSLFHLKGSEQYITVVFKLFNEESK